MATWTMQAEGGPKRVNHAAVCVDGIIYSFGGYCTGDDFSVRKDIDIYAFNTATYQWKPIIYKGKPDDIPYQRYGHTVVAYKGSCYIYGGRNDVNGVSEHLYRFDIATRTWHRPKVQGTVPFSRDGHSCCVVGEKMYLYAGFEEQSMEFSKSVYELDMNTYTWKYCVVSGTEPDWRDFHTATAWRTYMIVFGGRSDEFGPLHTGREVYNHDIYMFNTLSYHWTKPNPPGIIPYGRRSHNAFEYRGKIYLFGGYNGKLKTHYNDIHIFDPEKNTWQLFKPCGQPPRIRRRSCCCVYDNKVFIFGGTSPEQHGDSEVLTDLSDLHTLDMAPSLKMLATKAILTKQINIPKDYLPVSVLSDIQMLSSTNPVTRGPHG